MAKFKSFDVKPAKNAGGKCSCCGETIYNGERFFRAIDGKYCKHCEVYAQMNHPVDIGDIAYRDDNDKIYTRTEKGFEQLDI